MEKVQIRPATQKDLPTLLAFEQGIVTAERPFDPTLGPDPIHYYDLSELIEAEDAQVLVAVLGGEMIASGYAKIQPAKTFLDHDFYAYIGFMFVTEDQRGKGISQQIIDGLISWSKERGIIEVRLEVYDGNTSAVRAYEKSGFTKNLVEMRIRI